MSERTDLPMIHLRGVVKTYEEGRLRALDDVDVDIEAGEFVAIVGPSGCGKSTLLNMIAALDRPDEGIVEVAGHDLTGRRDLPRLGQRDSGGPPSDQFQPGLLPVLSAVKLGIDADGDRPESIERHPEIGVGRLRGTPKSARRDADHGDWMAVQSNDLAHHARIAAEALLPKSMADHGDRLTGLVLARASRRCIAGGEETPLVQARRRGRRNSSPKPPARRYVRLARHGSG